MENAPARSKRRDVARNGGNVGRYDGTGGRNGRLLMPTIPAVRCLTERITSGYAVIQALLAVGAADRRSPETNCAWAVLVCLYMATDYVPRSANWRK